jgi:hypothetical protein
MLLFVIFFVLFFFPTIKLKFVSNKKIILIILFVVGFKLKIEMQHALT